ncbi:MAG TPA: invasion associated locus B family protein [Devosia sp.]|nr:invasion associated locus B family protein [Devosia sp.]
MNTRLLAFPAAAALTLLLAACGGDPAPAPQASSSSAPPPAASSSVPDQAAIDKAAADKAAADAAAAQAAATQAAAEQAAKAAAAASLSSQIVAQAEVSSAPPPAASSQPAPAASSQQPAAGASTTPASTGPANQTPPKPEQNWLKICEPLASGQKACLMRQVIVTSNNQFAGSFVLRDDPGQATRLTAVAAVPVGVLLPQGLYWQIDNDEPIRTDFYTCDPLSCSTQQFVNEKFINLLKKGSVLKLIARNRKNEELVVSVNLAGFTAVYDGDTSLTFEQFNQQRTGQAALEKVLQDRAEALRQQLDGGTSSSAPPAQ